MKLLAALSLLGVASALPQAQSSGSPTPPTLGAFTVMAARSGSPIHYMPMTANETSLWLGGKTASYCPKKVEEMAGSCPPGNETVVVGGSALDVEVPGGQQIYISRAGALKFTRPHSANIPAGSIKSGFEYKPGNPFGHWNWAGKDGSGFMACPVPGHDGRWEIFASVKDAVVPTGDAGDCLGFEALAVPFQGGVRKPAAWEYV